MTTPPPVGQRLKDERERLGLQRVDVTRATKIYVHHLAALEFGRYDELPDERIVEAYVRAYAEHLGLPGDALVKELRSERGLPEAGPPEIVSPPPPDAAEARSRWGWWIAGAAAVLLAVAAFFWPREGPRPPVVAPPVAQTAPVIEIPPSEPPSSPPPAPIRVASFSIPEHGVGTGVIDHRLVGASDRFPVGSEVWFWTSVRGGTSGTTIRHVWLRDGRQVLAVPLTLGGEHWRTQSSTVLRPGSAGAWTVEARDAEGNVLARDTFTCSP